MTRKSIKLLLALVLVFAMALSVSAAYASPAVSSNIDRHFYINADRWAAPITSTLSAEGDGYVRVENIDDYLVVEQYDADLNFVSGKKIALELPLYGGVYMCDDYNFVVVGQKNLTENDKVEVYRVIRYSKNWVRQDSASVYGANTIVPFDCGSLRFDRSGDILYIRTARTLYTSGDGFNHQAAMMIEVRLSDMSAYINDCGHVSHSFNQFVRVDGTDLLTVDHGDYYPRSVVMIKYTNPAGQLSTHGNAEYLDVLPIVDSTGHYNDTGVCVGGFEFSSSHYLVAGNSYHQQEPMDLYYAHRNIFVTATDKNNFSEDGTSIHWLTHYDADDQVKISTPHFVKVASDRFMLLWTENGVAKYCFVNGKGEQASAIITINASLSDCVPIVSGNRIIWYVTDDSAPVFYKLKTTLPFEGPAVKTTNQSSTGRTVLSWEPVLNAERFEIYRSSSKSGTYTLLDTITGTSFTDTDAVYGNTYYYYVRAISSNGKYADSSIITSICKLSRPVITVSNVDSTGDIRISWNAVESAAKYKVYYSTAKNGTYTALKTTTATSVTHASAVAGKTYYYKVIALDENTAANSVFSAVKSCTCYLARPAVTVSNVASSGKIKISWNVIEDAVKYKVYYSTSKDGTYTALKTTTATSLTHASAVVGKTYYYKVIALAENTGGNSPFSDVKSCTCDLARPVVTLGNVITTGKIKISWEAVPGAVKYKVYCATSKDGTYTALKTTTATSLTHASAVAGETYYYKVIALAEKSAANSAFSAVKYRTCKLAQPETDVDLGSSGKPVLTWKPVFGAVKYKIYIYDAKGNQIKTTTTTGTKVTHSTAVSGSFYTYRVVAMSSNSEAHSAMSFEVSIKSR